MLCLPRPSQGCWEDHRRAVRREGSFLCRGHGCGSLCCGLRTLLLDGWVSGSPCVSILASLTLSESLFPFLGLGSLGVSEPQGLAGPPHWLLPTVLVLPLVDKEAGAVVAVILVRACCQCVGRGRSRVSSGMCMLRMGCSGGNVCFSTTPPPILPSGPRWDGQGETTDPACNHLSQVWVLSGLLSLWIWKSLALA